MVGNSSDSKLLARTNSQQSLRPPVATLQPAGVGGGVTSAAPSPDGCKVAVACKDGVLRIYDAATASLVAGFKVGSGWASCRQVKTPFVRSALGAESCSRGPLAWPVAPARCHSSGRTAGSFQEMAPPCAPSLHTFYPPLSPQGHVRL